MTDAQGRGDKSLSRRYTFDWLVPSACSRLRGKVHDAKVMDRLIREDDGAVHGDKGYASDEKGLAAAAGVLWAVKEKV